MRSSRALATEAFIAYGWESRHCYRNWFKSTLPTKNDIAALQGPILNSGSPQSRHAEALLELFASVLLPDSRYMERVKRHYRLFRATVDLPGNPLLRRRRSGG